jgi:hypothetical protein
LAIRLSQGTQVCFGRSCLSVFGLRWKNPPSGEGENVEEDQIHEGNDHEKAEDARKACLTEDLPVRNDDDKSGQQERDEKGKRMVMHHAEVVGVGGLEIRLAHGPESYAGFIEESRESRVGT